VFIRVDLWLFLLSSSHVAEKQRFVTPAAPGKTCRGVSIWRFLARSRLEIAGWLIQDGKSGEFLTPIPPANRPRRSLKFNFIN
jgi:hypothetical protein